MPAHIFVHSQHLADICYKQRVHLLALKDAMGYLRQLDYVQVLEDTQEQ